MCALHAPSAESIFGPSVRLDRSGNITTFELPDSEAGREELRQHVVGQANEARSEARERAVRLRRLVGRVDAIDLLTQCALLHLSGNARTTAADRYGNDAVLEYIAGLALSMPRGERRPLDSTVVAAWELATETVTLEMRRLVCTPGSDDLPAPVARAQFLFRAQYLFDRTEGYAAHQGEIMRRLFEPMRAECVESLGFAPSDIPSVVFAVHRLIQTRSSGAFQEIARRPRHGPLDEAGWTECERVADLRSANRDWFVFDPADVARSAGIPAAEATAMLSALSCGFGCQPEFLLPTDHNRFRRQPFVSLPDGRFFMALVWAPLQEFIPWFLSLVDPAEHADLRARFLRRRDRAAEELVREELRRVFGAEAVLGPLEYDLDARPHELDALVELPGACLVAEVKAHQLGDPARRGAPNTVRKRAKELIDKPLEQSRRAERYLLAGGRRFRSASGEEVELRAPAGQVVRLGVSLERADPLTLVPGIASDPDASAWVVSVADLMMVAQILDDPAAFFAYARTRAAIGRDTGVTAFMEADFLGSFLRERLGPLLDGARDHSDLEQMLGYNAEDLNAYFALRDAGLEAEKPSHGVPDVVLDALTTLCRQGHACWATLATAVFAEPSETWAEFVPAWRTVRLRGRRMKAACASFRGRGGLQITLLAARSRRALDDLADRSRRDGSDLGIGHARDGSRELAVAAPRPQ